MCGAVSTVPGTRENTGCCYCPWVPRNGVKVILCLPRKPKPWRDTQIYKCHITTSFTSEWWQMLQVWTTGHFLKCSMFYLNWYMFCLSPPPRLFASIVRLVYQTLKLLFRSKPVTVRTFLGQEPLVCSLLQGPLHSVCFISRFPGSSAQVTLKWDKSLELSSPIGLVSFNGIFYRGPGKGEEEGSVNHASLFIFWICQCEQSLYSYRESKWVLLPRNP